MPDIKINEFIICIIFLYVIKCYKCASVFAYGISHMLVLMEINFNNRFFFPDVDTDGLDTDAVNTVEEVIEFFVKEEQTVIE